MSYPPSPWIKRTVQVALLVAGVALLVAVGDIVRLLLVSALLAYLADPLVRILQARGLGRTYAASLVFVALLVLMTGCMVWLVPQAARQLEALRTGFSLEAVNTSLHEFEARLEGWLAPAGVGDLALVAQLEALGQRWLSRLPGYVPGVMGQVVNLSVIPFFMFFLLKDGPAIRKGIINAVPNRYFELMLGMIHKMDAQLGGYLRGQFLAALVVGALATATLWALEVPYFVVIGVVAGLANMIPYLGPIAGALLAVLVSLLTYGSVGHALAIVLAFVVIQQIDNLIVQPLVLSQNVALPPLLILLSVLVGGKLFGFTGLLFAVPVTAILKVAFLETRAMMQRYRFG